ncbi:MAG: hypothetical protein GXP30_09655 [Verrucomicrobia bacterium]|nr:hypothetical protein [Verrucomicrobiota bacterium]
MRTTVDLPDTLIKRIKFHTANKKVTFRSLVITALEKELSAEKKSFRLRDASVGNAGESIISDQTINQHLNAGRDFDFQA